MTRYGYTSHRGNTRRASPDRRLARNGSSSFSEGIVTQTRKEKSSVGVAMVGGRYQPGWDAWAQAGIHDSWLRLRVDAQAGVEACARALAPTQSRGNLFALRCHVWGFYRTSFRSHFSPH